MNTRKIDFLFVPAVLAGLILIYFYQYLDPRVIANATDVLTQQLFWEQFSHEQLHTSPSFATWLPYVNGGIPFGGGLEKLFRPLSFLFFYFCPPNLAMSLDVILHFWLMAFGTYLFTRLIGLSIPAAFLSGLFFSLSAEQVTLMNAGHFGKLNTIAWTPLVFWGLERGLRSRRWFDFILAGTILSAQLFEGHIQISFYVCIAVGIYFIGRTLTLYLSREAGGREISRVYLGGVLMVAVFLSLSAFTLAHWFEFKGQSERGTGMAYQEGTNWSFPPEEIATFVVPQFFGLSRANYYHPNKIDVYYWGRMPFAQATDYLGILPWFLVIFALARNRNQYVKIFGFIAVFFFILAMGKHTPIYYLFYEYAGFKFFRVPKMNLFLLSFAIAVIAGFGAQWLAEGEKDRSLVKKVFLGGAVLIFLLSAAYISGRLMPEFFVSEFGRHLSGSGFSYTRSPAALMQRFQNILDGVLISALLMAVLMGGLFAVYRYKPHTKLVWAGMAVFFLVDVSIINFQFMDTIYLKGSIYVDRNAAIRYFQENPGRYRILNATNHPSTYNVHNKFLMYKIESATGYEAVGMARYSEFQEFLSLEGNLIDLLNVKYVIMGKNDVPGTLGDRVGKYDIVLDEDVKVLRNNEVIPRAFPVHQAMVMKDKNQVLMWLNNPLFDPRKAVILENAVNLPLPSSPRPETESTVLISSYKNDEIRIDASMADNGFVVLSEKYYPGWKAYLDGLEIKIYQADYAFRAVYVPKGSHKLIVRYEPESYKKGLYISMVSLLLVAGIFVYHGVIGKRSS